MRRQTKRDSAARTPVVLGLAAAGALAVAAAPFAAIEVARSRLADEPCISGSNAAPPSGSFYSAIALLDRMSGVPGAGGRASRLAQHATNACADAWIGACSAVQDPAMAAARAAQEAQLGFTESPQGAGSTSWRDHVDRESAVALCTAWAEWTAWLDAQGLRSVEACPVCAPR